MYLLIGVDWVGFQSLTSNIYGRSTFFEYQMLVQSSTKAYSSLQAKQQPPQRRIQGGGGGGAPPLAEPGFYYRGGQLNGRDTPSRVPTGPANACWFLVQMPEAKNSSVLVLIY